MLHGVLAVVNLALLMWLIPDELGDEVWAPRRGRGRGRRQPSDFQCGHRADGGVHERSVGHDSRFTTHSTDSARAGVRRSSHAAETGGQWAAEAAGANQPERTDSAKRLRARREVRCYHALPCCWPSAGLTAVIGFVVWIRRRRMLRGSPS